MIVSRLAIFSPLFLLFACAAPPSAVPADQQALNALVSQYGGSDELLAYHQSLATLSRAELLAVLDGLLLQPDSPVISAKTAMVLGTLGRKGDYSEAHARLQGLLVDENPQAKSMKPLASVLASNYAASQKLRQQLEKTERQLAESQARIDQLTKMLNELKAMERALPSRLGTPAPVRRK